MRPFLGGLSVVCSYPEPVSQDHEPAGAELDEFVDTRRSAVGTGRTGCMEMVFT